MKKNALIVIILFLILGCGEDKGKIRIWLIDAPPPQDVEHIYLTTIAVGVRDAEGEPITLADYPYTVDIVRLTGGRFTTISYSPRYGDFVEVEAGNYKSVLLLLADSNSVVRDNATDALLIPINPEDSMPKISYELKKEFTVFPGQSTTIVVDFDASKSINWESEPYELNPAFRIFEYSEAGFIQGKVITLEDTLEVPVKFAVLRAANSTDTITTLSDSTGSYSLFLTEDTYNISAYAEGFSVDTVYERITISSDSALMGYDFILTEQWF